VHWADAGLKVVKAFEDFSEGDGLALSAAIQDRYGFGIDFTVTEFADNPVVPIAVEPSWHPFVTDAPPLEFRLDEGEADDRLQPPRSGEQPVEWYELDTPERANTTVGGSFVHPVDWPSTSPATEPIAAVALIAPVRNLLGNSSSLTADRVALHAAELGAMERDEEAHGWFLDIQVPGTAGRRRRRAGVILYLDPITGFIVTVEQTADGSFAFAYFVLEPGLIPPGVAAVTLMARRR
jgi:hypothetical protein